MAKKTRTMIGETFKRMKVTRVEFDKKNDDEYSFNVFKKRLDSHFIYIEKRYIDKNISTETIRIHKKNLMDLAVTLIEYHFQENHSNTQANIYIETEED